MDKTVIEVVEKFIEPMMQKISQHIEDRLRMEQNKTGGIPKSDALLKQEVEQATEAVKQWVLNIEDVERMEEGIKTLMEKLDRVPNKQEILENLKQVESRLSSRSYEDEEELEVYETFQEMWGVSKETFNSWYAVGKLLFEEKEIEKARNIFLFLSFLNTYVFEPWLALGICCQLQHQVVKALSAYTTASLIDFTHPEPHLNSATCYLSLDKELAQATLDLALAQMTEEQNALYQPQIQSIQHALKAKEV